MGFPRVLKSVRQRAVLLAVALLIVSAVGADAQQPGRKGGGQARNMANLIPPLEEIGFQSIFDGKSLKGWDGDPTFWRVVGGAIVGETTTEK